MITTESYGISKSGREVFAFTLHDGEQYAKILSLGALVESIVVYDAKGELTDVVLGHYTVADYENNRGCLGAIIGRFANRILGGKLILDGKECALAQNERGNHKHGGKVGFDKRIWDYRIEGEELVLSLFSEEGEENYPGNLKVEVRYKFQNGRLDISYRAETDKTTAVNLTNHTYFNLNGEDDGSIWDNELWLDSDEITPTDENQIPIGGFRKIAGTPFDFNTPKLIGRDIDREDVDLKRGGGYDHCYLLKNKCGEWVRYAVARSKKSGIVMTCYTDMPAVQFYSGNGLNQMGKRSYYGKRAGFCLETQEIPNNVNVPEYAARGSSVLKAGEVYSFHAAYEFSVEK